MKTGTIYALASGPGRAGLQVFRVSGPGAAAALEALTGALVPPPRRAARTRLRNPETGDEFDHGLVLWFPGPASYTGEDVAELHVHGGRAVAQATAAALDACPDLRQAEPGEFTRRAFENGKLDLTAAEGLADLVAAETEAQRRQALRQMEGELGRLYDGWRERLVRALARFEATIDFSDEELPGGLAEGVRAEARALRDEIAAHLADNRRGERVREGVHIAIIGAPNVGKSSLLNLLAKRDAAIVSDQPGTTRDVIEVHLDLGGYAVTAADTAGLRAAGDRVEREGVRRARVRAGDADLKLALFEAAHWPPAEDSVTALVDADTLVAVNKIDLVPAPALDPETLKGRPAYGVSVKTGAGIDGLLAALEEAVGARCASANAPVLTRQRHRTLLEEARQGLDRMLAAQGAELQAEDLRLAIRALGAITGQVDVEDLLDVIFADFCIGK